MSYLSVSKPQRAMRSFLAGFVAISTNRAFGCDSINLSGLLPAPVAASTPILLAANNDGSATFEFNESPWTINSENKVASAPFPPNMIKGNTGQYLADGTAYFWGSANAGVPVTLVHFIFTQAEEAHRKSRLRSLRDLDAAAVMLRDVGRHVVADEDDEMPVTEWKQALFEQIARPDIEAAMASVDSLVTAPDDRRYQELRPHWRRAQSHRFAIGHRPIPGTTRTN